MTDPTISALLADLAGLRLREQDVATVFDRVAQLAVRALPGCEVCSVTLRERQGPRTAAITDPAYGAIDEHEYRTGAGPCIEAMETGELQRCDDLTAEERWPEFVPVAREHGVVATLGVPLCSDGTVLGALNLYATRPDALRVLDDGFAQLFAGVAGIFVENIRAYLDAVVMSDQLRDAMSSRAVIEQAKGVLMARHGCSADEAFGMLTTASQRENTKLRDVAARVVANVATPAHGGCEDRASSVERRQHSSVEQAAGGDPPEVPGTGGRISGDA